VAFFQDLVHPGLVPEIDPVRDDAEGRHRPALEEAPYQPLLLRTEDSRKKQEEGEPSVKGLPSDVEGRLRVDGDNRYSDVRHRPEAGACTCPRDPGEPARPHPADLSPFVMHPCADHRQTHPECEEVQERGKPDGGQMEVRRVAVLKLEDGITPGIADHDHDRESEQFDAHPLPDRPRRPVPTDQGGIQRDIEVEAHLDTERPRGRDAFQRLIRRVDLKKQIVGGVCPPAVGTDARTGMKDGGRHEEDEPVCRDDAQHTPEPERAGSGLGCRGEVRHHERPVQQEPRYEEEHRDADLEPGGVDPDAVVGSRETGDETDVDDHNRDRSDSPETIECGKARWPTRCWSLRSGLDHGRLDLDRDGVGQDVRRLVLGRGLRRHATISTGRPVRCRPAFRAKSGRAPRMAASSATPASMAIATSASRAKRASP
jgi:hypothetical protein